MQIFNDDFRDAATLENLKELLKLLEENHQWRLDNERELKYAAQVLIEYYGVAGVDF